MGFSVASYLRLKRLDIGFTIFQFPLLGIFRCIRYSFFCIIFGKSFSFNSRYLGFSVASYMISDPIAFAPSFTFQFPLLGIFRCIRTMSIRILEDKRFLSIPATWDFPLHHILTFTVNIEKKKPFNSRYLGFSVASFFNPTTQRSSTILSFNSRYLGFSVASL